MGSCVYVQIPQIDWQGITQPFGSCFWLEWLHNKEFFNKQTREWNFSRFTAVFDIIAHEWEQLFTVIILGYIPRYLLLERRKRRNKYTNLMYLDPVSLYFRVQPNDKSYSVQCAVYSLGLCILPYWFSVISLALGSFRFMLFIWLIVRPFVNKNKNCKLIICSKEFEE